MPNIRDRTHYLMLVKSKDGLKEKIRHFKTTRKETPIQKKKSKTKFETSREAKKSKEPKMKKIERQAKYNELKHELKEVWTTNLDSLSEKHEGISVPSNFKN